RRKNVPEPISAGFEKLLREPAYCQLATLMPDGSPQITQVWVDTDGEHVLVNTAEGRQKTKNVRRDPRVAVNVVDPNNAWRLGEVRGRVVDVTTEGADKLIDELAKKYLDADTYPFRDPSEVRVTLKILPEKTNEVGLEG
ncbi:MAG TPA: PPOX class F420-dependent oxidoreductase, partial [Rubrobacter sp.]|nr:PPOX class F420-dependent oxidoreductase [Rubrobacter sp.]